MNYEYDNKPQHLEGEEAVQVANLVDDAIQKFLERVDGSSGANKKPGPRRQALIELAAATIAHILLHGKPACETDDLLWMIRTRADKLAMDAIDEARVRSRVVK
jgi:hypothetical protein